MRRGSRVCLEISQRRSAWTGYYGEQRGWWGENARVGGDHETEEETTEVELKTNLSQKPAQHYGLPGSRTKKTRGWKPGKGTIPQVVQRCARDAGAGRRDSCPAPLNPRVQVSGEAEKGQQR